MPRSARAIGRGWIAALLAIAFGALLVGCGGGTSTGEGNAESGQEKPPAKLTVAFDNGLTTLDADLAGQDIDANAVHLTGGMLQEQQAGGKLVDVLAESFKPSKDFKTWTAVLKPGLKFSDGSPLAAKDVVATWNRTIKDQNKLGNLSILSVVAVKELDPRTVEFTLVRPEPEFNRGLISAPIYPAKGLEEGEAFFKRPISAGPYKISSGGVGSSDLTLTLNPYYVGPKPVIPSVKFVVIPSPSAAAAALKSGQVDMVFSLPPNLIPSLEGEGLTTKTVKAWGWLDLVPRATVAPMNDPKVREAMSLAVNRSQIVESIWPSGGNVPVGGFWPPGFEAFDPSLGTEQNVEKAKELLAGTPCANGCDLNLQYPEAVVPYSSQMALVIQSNLAEVGIHVNLVNVDFGTWAEDNLNNKCGCLTLSYVWVREPSPATLAAELLPPFWAFSFLEDKQTEDLANQLIATPPESPKHKTLMDSLQKRFVDVYPVIPLAGFTQTFATRLSPTLAYQDVSTYLEIERK